MITKSESMSRIEERIIEREDIENDSVVDGWVR